MDLFAAFVNRSRLINSINIRIPAQDRFTEDAVCIKFLSCIVHPESLALEAVTKSYARCERRLPLSLLRGWRLEPSPDARAADCAICQEPVADGALRLPCGHLYHEPCMRAWMHSHSSCPTCRFELDVCDGPGTDAA